MKSVVVTGASTGIGRSLAVAWGAAGARVVLVARSEAKLAEAAGEVARAGGEPVVVVADVTRPADRDRVLDVATAGGRGIDVLVNNAGRGLYGSFASLGIDAVRELFELNVLAPLALTQLALPSLEARGGTVVFVSSVAGVIAVPRTGAYAASKFALEALAMSLRAELAGRSSPVRVVVARPGLTDTPFPDVAPSTDGLGSTRPAGVRGMRPERVAADIVHAVEQGAAIVTPGLANRAATLGQRLAPGAVRFGLARLARRIAR